MPAVRIIVYSRHDSSSIRDSLGMIDYSYHFVLEAFRPMLAQCGEVVRIADPAVDLPALLEQAAAMDVSCVFLSFAPPHATCVDANCPVVPVFAWEFSSLPDVPFADDWRNDWVEVMRRCGQAITHSSFAARLVRECLGEEFPVVVLPAPVWDDYAGIFVARRGTAPGSVRELSLDCMVLDSACLDIDAASVLPCALSDGTELLPASGRCWSGEDLQVGPAGLLLVGFHAAEPWGVWSRESAAWLALPEALHGRVRISVRVAAHGTNIGRRLGLRVGSGFLQFEPGAEFSDVVLECQLDTPCKYILFEGMIPQRPEGGADARTLGIALAGLSITRPEDAQSPDREAAPPLIWPLRLAGCVYVAIFNPKDGRKNWQDMLTAFCAAFGERSDATLVLKMTHHDVSVYIDEVFLLFRRLAPFSCRIVVLHGYMEPDAYRDLIAATDFIVSASCGEGQCLPLMEYMSAGVPAIAPRNSALLDYIDDESALVVNSTPEPAHWPQDPRQALGTLRHRISWQSLFDAFTRSFEIRMNDPDSYERMREAASRSQQAFCSRAVLEPRLGAFLAAILAGNGSGG